MAAGTEPARHDCHDADGEDWFDVVDDDGGVNDVDKEALPVVLVARWILHSSSVHSPLLSYLVASISMAIGRSTA